jgi:predicted RNA binding protein YcfA (HicA-like mRNA interferase family)
VHVFSELGYKQAGQKRSHIKMEKPGAARLLIVAHYDEVGRDIISGLIRTAGIDARCVPVTLLKHC